MQVKESDMTKSDEDIGCKQFSRSENEVMYAIPLAESRAKLKELTEFL
jgi:hypothetical protein